MRYKKHKGKKANTDDSGYNMDSYIQPNKPKCHTGPVEVIPGLYCGAEREFLQSLRLGLQLDTLVPLNTICGSVWKSSFRGEILYYPIEDYSNLPDDVLEDLADKIISRIQAGKKVGLFCFGGHGRTGYVAAVVLGKLGYDDPIAFLRKNYCENAVESFKQAKHISKILGIPELSKHFTSRDILLEKLFFGYEILSDGTVACDEASDNIVPEIVCGNCRHYKSGRCTSFGVIVDKDAEGCWDFSEK